MKIKPIGAVIALSILLSNLIASGQALLPSDYHSVKAVPTPNAASLGKYGDFKVDLFTGTPSINIPLTSIANSGITVPVSLNYHSAGGVQVAELPGWASLGWSVIAGGQITRKVNWIPDEYYNRHPNSTAYLDDKGYFFRGNLLDNSFWNTTLYMQDVFTVPLESSSMPLHDGEPDEFNFSFGGYSGTFYRSEKSTWQIKSNQNLGLEISVEIDTSGHYKLYRDFNPINGAEFEDPTNFEEISSLFTKFTITTPNGYRYEFGGDRAAIEFSRGQIGGVKPGFDGLPQMDDRRNHIVANAWYLTKIITPLKDSIIFNYKRGKVIFQKYRILDIMYESEQLTGSGNINSSSGNTWVNSAATASNPSFLSSIETPLAKIEFVRSQAIELGPETTVLSHPPIHETTFKNSIANNWKDLAYADINSPVLPNYNQQLDSIKVFDKTAAQYATIIKLFHRSNPTKRRTLDSVAIIEGNTIDQKYKFEYANVDELPNYESLKKDHYGYFNGGTTEPTIAPIPNRDGNAYGVYGLLKKITYPTGGETEFVFEPNAFSSTIGGGNVMTNPKVFLHPTSGVAGARIAKITNKPGFGSAPMVTEYHYTQNYSAGGTSSSGVLGAMSRYTDTILFENDQPGGWYLAQCEGLFRLSNTTNDNSEWLSQARGGMVTYAEVTQKNPDGSYVINKYSNNDNALYRDDIADNYTVTHGPITVQNNYRVTSNDLERGKILSEEYFNADDQKIKKIEYEYTNNPERKNKYIKSLPRKNLLAPYINACPQYSNVGGTRIWATKIYYYSNPLKRRAELLYANSGNLLIVTNYSYDDYGNQTKVTTHSSDGKWLVKDTKFNSDISYHSNAASGSTAVGIQNLFNVHKIKNYPIEQFLSVYPDVTPNEAGSVRITGGNVFSYDAAHPVLKQTLALELSEPFYPVTYIGNTPFYHFTNSAINSSGDFVYDPRYKVQEAINAYTAYPPGNAVKPTGITGISGNSAYTWDHNIGYQTSATRNALAHEVAFSSFEGIYIASGASDDNRGNWEFKNANLITGGFTGKKALRLSYTNGDFIRSNNTLASGKQYVVSFWAKGTEQPLVQLGSGSPMYTLLTPLKVAGQWRFYRHEVTGTGEQISLVPVVLGQSTSVDIDELRLYPAAASMSSYNYEPSQGNVTSISDEKDNVTFYEYDGLGRLLLVRDEKGQIISKNTYRFQGAQ